MNISLVLWSCFGIKSLIRTARLGREKVGREGRDEREGGGERERVGEREREKRERERERERERGKCI